jgi:hypothetical protein
MPMRRRPLCILPPPTGVSTCICPAGSSASACLRLSFSARFSAPAGSGNHSRTRLICDCERPVSDRAFTLSSDALGWGLTAILCFPSNPVVIPERPPESSKGPSLKRSFLILCSSAACAVALALPGVASAGWSWNGTDGWTWTGDSAGPAPEGWSWGDESVAPADPSPSGDQTSPDGWSWGESE